MRSNRRLSLGGLLLALATAAGCGVQDDWPAEFPVSHYSLAQLGGGEEKPFVPNPVVNEKLYAFLVAEFGTPAEPKLKSADEERNRSIYKGSRLYRVQCMYCHGLGGAGNGPSASSYDPRPRDYRRGAFKWKSTTLNQKPTRDDLYRTIHDGISGTSMPPFKLLPEDALRNLVEYIVFLSERGELEFKLLAAATQAPDKEEDMKDFLEDFADRSDKELEKINKAWESAKPMTIAGRRPNVDSDPAKFEASVQSGRLLYLGNRAGCVKCHGTDGRGARDPAAQSPDDLKDVWGNLVQPRNLTTGVFRGGRTPVDVYRRVHQGIGPSKMPGSEKSLKTEEIWDLVNFVRALQYRPDLLSPSQGSQPGG